MKGKTTILFVIAFVLAIATLAAAQGGASPNGFGGGGFGKGGGGFGKGKGGGGFGKGGPPPPPPPPQDNGKNAPPPPPQDNGKGNGKNNDDKAQICNNGALQLSDGTQVRDQPTCATTQMGQIPTFDNMVASMIVEPQDRSTVQANQPFDVAVAIANMETGFFSDADTQYYSESQQLNGQGLIQGHCHITIQQVQPNQKQPADARVFAFFEGLNDPAQNGILRTTVPGLAKGFYRACSMTSAFTHQPVVMPVAKRGAQDDCIRFTVR